MNLILNDKWKQVLSNINTEEVKVLDITLTNNSVLHAVECSNDRIVFLKSEVVLTNADILDIQLHNQYK